MLLKAISTYSSLLPLLQLIMIKQVMLSVNVITFTYASFTNVKVITNVKIINFNNNVLIIIIIYNNN